MSGDMNRNDIPNPNKNVWTVDSASVSSKFLVINDRKTHLLITPKEPMTPTDLLNALRSFPWVKVYTVSIYIPMLGLTRGTSYSRLHRNPYNL